MSNQTTTTARLVTKRQVKQLLENALELTSKEFIKDVLDKMKKSKPRGRVYYSRRKGFHRASAPGQRPAIDTATLFSAFNYKMFPQHMASVVYIGPNINPENGARADRYAEILQVARNRQIMTARDANSFKKVLKAKVQRIASIFG